MGRRPEPDDLIVPSRQGNNRSVNHMLKKFHKDLGRIGLRPRRQHDLRRTFISLAMGDGARKDILRWVTHTRPRSDTVDDYTTLVWQPLCEEVAKLRITLRRPPEAAAKVANSRDPDPPLATGLATGSANPEELHELELAGWTGLEPAASGVTGGPKCPLASRGVLSQKTFRGVAEWTPNGTRQERTPGDGSAYTMCIRGR
jgi:hypothetical protein